MIMGWRSTIGRWCGTRPPSGSNERHRARNTAVRKLARVVVVDDHPFFRDGLSRGLRQSGYLDVVGEAGSGREGLELIRELQPNVAVLDYQMPDLDGLDVVHAIVRGPGWPSSSM